MEEDHPILHGKCQYCMYSRWEGCLFDVHGVVVRTRTNTTCTSYLTELELYRGNANGNRKVTL